MKSAFAPLVALFAVVPLVAGHGWVDSVTIDGKKYDGNMPTDHTGGTTVQSPIRQISDNGPVVLARDPENLPCGRSAKNAALVADAMPGSKYTTHWGTNNGQPWPHKVGPIMTYMASCGSTTCDQFDASQAQWFKIAQFSFVPGGKDPETGGLMWWHYLIKESKPIDVMLPTDIAPGGYLIRQEIISMQSVPIEFYPSCTQVNIGGSSTGKPSSTITFPAGYSADDPSFKQDIYGQNIDTTFIFPAGPLSNLANANQAPGGTAGVAGGPGGAGGSAPVSSAAGGAPATTATDAGTASSMAPTSTMNNGIPTPSPASSSSAAAISDVASSASPSSIASSAAASASATSAASQPASSGKCGIKLSKRRNTYVVPKSRVSKFSAHVARKRRAV